MDLYKGPSHATPPDLPPVAHEHDWQLADVEKGKKTYSGMAVGTSVFEYVTGKKPDIARYICVCGEQKKVTVNES